MKKKLLALALAAAMALSLAACGGGSSSSQSNASGSDADTDAQTQQPADTSGTEDPAEPAGDSYTVGICQLVQHPALDAATQGFKDYLTEKLGGNVKFEEGNASGDPTNCPTIINGFLASNVDLILANATASLQAAAAATNTVPVLGTSITDYATALEIDNWTGTVGTNVSGTSDLAPLDEQAAMVKELFPDAKKVGLLYCSGEPNSVYQCDIVEEALKGLGYETARYTFTDSNDVASVTQTLCDECDVMYIPTDNTAANNTEAIANVAIPAGMPAVVGEEGICSGCGVATLSISYHDIGYIAGEMAYDILVNGADVSTMAVQFAPEVTKKYNAANCEALGLTVPSDYVAIETE